MSDLKNFSVSELPMYQEDIAIPLSYVYDPKVWSHFYPLYDNPTIVDQQTIEKARMADLAATFSQMGPFSGLGWNPLMHGGWSGNPEKPIDPSAALDALQSKLTGATMTQNALLRLRVVASKLTSEDGNPQHNGLWLRFFDQDTLARTVITSGPPIANDVNKGRGWYLESVKVGATSSTKGVEFQGAQPNERQQTGTVTSSSGWNVSGGMFGDQPTASVGYSENQSSSYSYEAITFYNDSQESLTHRYAMSSTVDDHSTPYGSRNDMFWSKVFHHAELRTPPHECFGGDLPIISQAYWTVPMDFSGVLNVSISFDFTWYILLNHDTDGVGDYKYHWWRHNPNVTRNLSVDWANLTVRLA